MCEACVRTTNVYFIFLFSHFFLSPPSLYRSLGSLFSVALRSRATEATESARLTLANGARHAAVTAAMGRRKQTRGKSKKSKKKSKKKKKKNGEEEVGSIASASGELLSCAQEWAALAFHR